MPHFQPSGVTHGVVFHCCHMGCGAKYETQMPVEVWGFPAQLHPITILSPPVGWDVRGRMVICPNHVPPGMAIN